MSDKKNYNETIAPGYKFGNGYGSVVLKSDYLLKKGSKLIFTLVPEERRSLDTTPECNFTVMTPEQVTAFNSRTPRNGVGKKTFKGKTQTVSDDDLPF